MHVSPHGRARVPTIAALLLLAGSTAQAPAAPWQVEHHPAPAADRGGSAAHGRVTLTGAARRSRTARRALSAGGRPCADGSGAICGTVDVPLDWRHPDMRTLAVDWKLFVHTDAGKARSTVWWNGGGPGGGTTKIESWVPGYLFGGVMASVDVLLTDVRGTGSSAIDCPLLQSASWPADDAMFAQCAAILGDTIADYGSAYAARDLNAVRKALGIAKLDLVGNSYGGMDATAYAVRFPEHTRSVVLSSAVDARATLRSLLTTKTGGYVRVLQSLCDASAGCAAGLPDVPAAFAEGLSTLHGDGAIAGVAQGANDDAPRLVTVSEGVVYALLEAARSGWMTNAGELPAAMRAHTRPLAMNPANGCKP